MICLRTNTSSVLGWRGANADGRVGIIKTDQFVLCDVDEQFMLLEWLDVVVTICK